MRCLTRVANRLAVLLAIAAVSAHAAPRPTEQDLIDIITIQPRSQRAPSAVLDLLDRLNANGRTDELMTWVDRMLAMPRLLDGRRDLVVHLQNLQVQGNYKRVRLAYAAARRAGDTAALRAACDGFVEVAAISTKHSVDVRVSDGFHVTSIADEATYNAGACYLEARDITTALRYLAAVKNAELSAIAWRQILAVTLRAPYAWLTD